MARDAAHGLIREVARLFEDKHRWTQGACARNAAGEVCRSLDAAAVAWDMRGAMIKLLGEYDYKRVMPALLVLATRVWIIPDWNDRVDHAEMHRTLLDVAG